MIDIDLNAARFHLLTGKPIPQIQAWIYCQQQHYRECLTGTLEFQRHYSEFSGFARSVVGRIRCREIPLFLAQTQSLEMIQSFFEAMQSMPPYELLLHRIEVTPEGLRVVTYDEESLTAALELHLEVR